MFPSLGVLYRTLLTPIAVFVVAAILSSCSSSANRPPTREIVDPVHGKELRLQYGAVEGIGETKANGIAFLKVYEDGVAVVTANINILPLEPPAVMKASLVVGTSEFELGELVSIVGDARHALTSEIHQPIAEGVAMLRVMSFARPGSLGVSVAKGELKVPAPAVFVN